MASPSTSPEVNATPAPPLFAITFAAPAAVPPTVLFDGPKMNSTPFVAFPIPAAPAGSVPIQFPSTALPSELNAKRIPRSPLKTITLPAPATVPPSKLLLLESKTPIPECVFPRPAASDALVPMKLPWMTFPSDPPSRKIPSWPAAKVLPAPGAVPPIRLFDESEICTPSVPLPSPRLSPWGRCR